MRVRTTSLAICLLVLVPIFLSGCTCPVSVGDLHVTWRVNHDDTADMVVELAPTLGDSLVRAAIEEVVRRLDQEGQVVTTGRTERPAGEFQALTFHFQTINDLETAMMAPGLFQVIPFDDLGIELPEELTELSAGGIVPFTRFDVQRDGSSALQTEYRLHAQASAEMVGLYASCFRTWFHADLPGTIDSTNATSREKGVPTWALQTGQALDMQLTSRQILGAVGSAVGGTAGIAVAAVIVVAALAIGIVMLVRSRRRKPLPAWTPYTPAPYDLGDDYADSPYAPSSLGTGTYGDPDFNLGDGYSDEPLATDDWGTEVSTEDY